MPVRPVLRPLVLAAFVLPAAVLVACSDNTVTQTTEETGGSAGTTSGGSTSGPSGTTTGEPTTTAGPTSASESTSTGENATEGTTEVGASTDASTGGSSGGGPVDCVAGELLCVCLPGDACAPGGLCVFGECAPQTGQCPFEFDGYCDEPDFCMEGTDAFDCCATQQNGVCEEKSGGGSCAKGTDWWDCDYCPFVDDGSCDDGVYCPDGTDANDCCASVHDGVCEEQSMGGSCPDGSDYFDCGYCGTTDDLSCDEGVTCPEGTDVNDCCATPGDGVCDEVGQGGMCPDGTDPGDCFECEWANDGECDEPNLCPPGSDGEDCCATPENGVCEEVDQGGVCPEGTDSLDCGECQWANDGVCDEPNLCPPGTDGDDCCAAVKNGVCEEVGEGGMCPDGSDSYDCGVCEWTNDGVCDEPGLCPPGSDKPDCP